MKTIKVSQKELEEIVNGLYFLWVEDLRNDKESAGSIGKLHDRLLEISEGAR